MWCGRGLGPGESHCLSCKVNTRVNMLYLCHKLLPSISLHRAAQNSIPTYKTISNVRNDKLVHKTEVFTEAVGAYEHFQRATPKAHRVFRRCSLLDFRNTSRWQFSSAKTKISGKKWWPKWKGHIESPCISTTEVPKNGRRLSSELIWARSSTDDGKKCRQFISLSTVSDAIFVKLGKGAAVAWV